MRTSLIACKVTPGDKGCKIAMPGCSALEIKHCALAPGAPPDARCTLALDLATHNFVLCSLPPGGRMQATLSTVVTNDPDQMAWLFLKATGPRAFHVLGRLIVDSKERTGVAAANKAAWAAVREQRRRSGAPVSIGVGTGDGESDEDGWPTAADIAPSRTAGGKKPTAREAADAQDDAEENIEVLLPEGDDRIEFESGAEDDPSEADSEEFVQWMVERASTGAASGAAKRPRPSKAALTPSSSRKGSGGSGGGGGGGGGGSQGGSQGSGQGGSQGGTRAQRRQAASKRSRGMALA